MCIIKHCEHDKGKTIHFLSLCFKLSPFAEYNVRTIKYYLQSCSISAPVQKNINKTKTFHKVDCVDNSAWHAIVPLLMFVDKNTQLWHTPDTRFWRIMNGYNFRCHKIL